MIYVWAIAFAIVITVISIGSVLFVALKLNKHNDKPSTIYAVLNMLATRSIPSSTPSQNGYSSSGGKKDNEYVRKMLEGKSDSSDEKKGTEGMLPPIPAQEDFPDEYSSNEEIHAFAGRLCQEYSEFYRSGYNLGYAIGYRKGRADAMAAYRTAGNVQGYGDTSLYDPSNAGRLCQEYSEFYRSGCNLGYAIGYRKDRADAMAAYRTAGNVQGYGDTSLYDPSKNRVDVGVTPQKPEPDYRVNDQGDSIPPHVDQNDDGDFQNPPPTDPPKNTGELVVKPPVTSNEESTLEAEKESAPIEEEIIEDISVSEMFDLVAKLESEDSVYLDYHFSLNRLVRAGDDNRRYILTPDNYVLPWRTRKFNSSAVDPDVYDCSVDSINRSNHIIYCKVDSSYNIIEKGKIW